MVAGVTPGKGGTNFEGIPIFNTVADIVGDSLALAREAADVDADVIELSAARRVAANLSAVRA